MSALELEDARESLAYWETRAARLPRHSIRQRREARQLAARWRLRVTEAERARYGRGVPGALLLLAAEGRLPQPALDATRRIRRTGARVIRMVAAAFVVITCVATVATAQLVAALIH